MFSTILTGAEGKKKRGYYDGAGQQASVKTKRPRFGLGPFAPFLRKKRFERRGTKRGAGVSCIVVTAERDRCVIDSSPRDRGTIDVAVDEIAANGTGFERFDDNRRTKRNAWRVCCPLTGAAVVDFGTVVTFRDSRRFESNRGGVGFFFSFALRR